MNEVLKRKMDFALEQGKINSWSQKQYKEALQSILSDERAKLISGERALNKHKRSWADVQKK